MNKIDQLIETVKAIKNLLECMATSTANGTTEVAEEPLMTAKEVQSLFGIVHSTYYRWIDRGYLKPVILGGKHYYRTKDIHGLLEKRTYRERGGFG